MCLAKLLNRKLKQSNEKKGQDMKLKLAVIGAGSSYCPELAQGLIERRASLPFSEIYLMDIDQNKLSIVGGFFKRVMEREGMDAKIVLTGDLKTAVEGADFIVSQIRVGGMEARSIDEKIPLKYDLIGQETTGVGGFFKAMRSIWAMKDIAQAIEQYAPNAWLVNFANPSGILAEYLLNYTSVKSIGLCNIPITSIETFANILNKDAESITVDSVGLNHLSWYTGIFHKGKEHLKDLVENGFAGISMKNIEDIEVDLELIKSIKAVPSPYLNYFYTRNSQLAKLKGKEKSRAEECVEVENELMEYYADANNNVTPEMLSKRGGHLYSLAAISLIESLYTGNGAPHVINVKNGDTLSFLEKDDVIETSCRVYSDRIERIPVSTEVNDSIIGLIQTVKKYEKLAVKSALAGDKNIAKHALMCHPLIGDATVSEKVIEEMLELHKQYLPQFFK